MAERTWDEPRARECVIGEIHFVANAQGLPIGLGLAAGRAHDGRIADRLLGPLAPRAIVLDGKEHQADRIREIIQQLDAKPNIPPKLNRKWKPCLSKRINREQSQIKRFLSKLKHFRCVAMR